MSDQAAPQSNPSGSTGQAPSRKELLFAFYRAARAGRIDEDDVALMVETGWDGWSDDIRAKLGYPRTQPQAEPSRPTPPPLPVSPPELPPTKGLSPEETALVMKDAFLDVVRRYPAGRLTRLAPEQWPADVQQALRPLWKDEQGRPLPWDQPLFNSQGKPRDPGRMICLDPKPPGIAPPAAPPPDQSELPGRLSTAAAQDGKPTDQNGVTTPPLWSRQEPVETGGKPGDSPPPPGSTRTLPPNPAGDAPSGTRPSAAQTEDPPDPPTVGREQQPAIQRADFAIPGESPWPPPAPMVYSAIYAAVLRGKVSPKEVAEAERLPPEKLPKELLIRLGFNPPRTETGSEEAPRGW